MPSTPIAPISNFKQQPPHQASVLGADGEDDEDPSHISPLPKPVASSFETRAADETWAPAVSSVSAGTTTPGGSLAGKLYAQAMSSILPPTFARPSAPVRRMSASPKGPKSAGGPIIKPVRRSSAPVFKPSA